MPFANSEYERRIRAVGAQAAELGVEAFCVTSQLSVRYLIGTACSSLSSPWPQPLLLVPGRRPIYLVREYDADRIAAQTDLVEVRTFFGGGTTPSALELWAAALCDLGLATKRIGLELARADLTPASVAALRALVPNAQFVDASAAVNSVMDMKSDAEIAAMRAASAMNARGFATFLSVLRDGASEAEVKREVLRELAAQGSESSHAEVVLGQNSAIPHAGYHASTRSVLRPGTPAFIEFSASVSDCASGLVRTALLGRSRDVEALYEVAQAAVDAIDAILRPGISAGEVDAAARRVVTRAGRGDTFRHRAGYACNAWITYGATAGSIDLSPGNPAIIRPRMAFHTPVNLFERGRFGVGCSETWLVTENGCEALSGLSRELRFV